MLQNYNKYKIAKLFFEQPIKQFQLREVSRLSKIAPPSAKRYLEELQKQGLIKEESGNIYRAYKACRDADIFKEWKQMSMLIELRVSGIIEMIHNSCSPDAIILFGSAARGEDIEKSDIDLAIISEEKDLKFEKYESKLHRKISLHFFPQFNKVSKELKNNVLNGIILSGYLKVFS